MATPATAAVRAGTPLLGVAADRVVRPDGTTEPGTVWIDTTAGTIVDVVRGRWGPVGAHPEDVEGRLLDLGDRIVAPGYVDVHVHGGAGQQVNGDDATAVAASLAEIARFHAAHGTTALMATTVSDAPARLAATVAGIVRAARAPRGDGHGARIVGCHLEGPFLSPVRAGAQDPAWIRNPDRAELQRLLEAGEGTVRIVTLAPELRGATELIADSLEAGATVALGHTDADFDTSRRAIDAGATHVVHMFDAMAPLDHRKPGLAAAALLDPTTTLEVIFDLHHVHHAALQLVMTIARGRTLLVTDATAAAGWPGGRHRLGLRDVEVRGTRVSLAADPSTLAGSALTMDTAVRNAVTDAGIPLPDALAAASAVPARVAGGAGSASEMPGAGNVTPGAPADLVVLEPSLEVAATIVAGKVAFDAGEHFA